MLQRQMREQIGIGDIAEVLLMPSEGDQIPVRETSAGIAGEQTTMELGGLVTLGMRRGDGFSADMQADRLRRPGE